jgi:hypothetical protein
MHRLQIPLVLVGCVLGYGIGFLISNHASRDQCAPCAPCTPCALCPPEKVISVPVMTDAREKFSVVQPQPGLKVHQFRSHFAPYAPGVDMNLSGQAELAKKCARYRLEFDAFEEWSSTRAEPYTGYYFPNNYYGFASAAMYHCMIRLNHPVRIVEVGCGMTTSVAAAALELNAADGFPGTVTCIDPAPRSLEFETNPITRHEATIVEKAQLTLFTDLTARDILMIDSSHGISPQNDVQLLFNEVVPLLAAGVLVHVHDICYPERPFNAPSFPDWNEEFILMSFLAFNTQFKVRWFGCMQWDDVTLRQKNIQANFGPRGDQCDASFWFQNIGIDGAFTTLPL